MPPKPPIQSKDITRILQLARNRFDAPAPTDETKRPNMQVAGQKIENKLESNSVNSVRNEQFRTFAAREDLQSFGTQSFLERIGISATSNNKPLSPIQQAEKTLRAIEKKLQFEDKVPAKAKIGVVNAIKDIIKDTNTSALVMDTLNSVSQNDSVKKIVFIKDPRLALTNNDAMYAPPAQALLIYNVNKDTSVQNSLRSFVHASAYAFQHDVMENVAFDHNAFLKAFDSDFKSNRDSKKIMEFSNKIRTARNANQNNIKHLKIASEIHAQFVEDSAIDPDGTKSTFPSIAQKVEELHLRYKIAVNPEQIIGASANIQR